MGKPGNRNRAILRATITSAMFMLPIGLNCQFGYSDDVAKEPSTLSIEEQRRIFGDAKTVYLWSNNDASGEQVIKDAGCYTIVNEKGKADFVVAIYSDTNATWTQYSGGLAETASNTTGFVKLTAKNGESYERSFEYSQGGAAPAVIEEVNGIGMAPNMQAAGVTAEDVLRKMLAKVNIEYAAEEGDSETVKVLLQEKPDRVFTTDTHGNTPLHLAASNGHKNVAELLLANKAVVDAKDNNGCTPLQGAAWNGHPDVAELLLANGADVNAKDNHGATALQKALERGYENLAETLVTHKADVNAKCDGYYHWTPLHFAAASGLKNVAALLLAKNVEVNSVDDDGNTPLHQAAQNGHKNVAELLLAYKADVDAKDNLHESPLHLAAQNGHKDVAELLLENRADVNAKDKYGYCPLHLAAQNDQKEVVELLVANQADINATANSGYTPLCAAVVNDQIDMAKFLLENDADVNVKDVKGYTPLHLAVMSNVAKNMTELLLSHGAEVNVYNSQGDTPLYIAVQMDRNDVAALLRQHGATSSPR